MKKLYLFLLIGLLTIGLTAGAWYFIIGGNIRVDIASLGSYKEAIITFNGMSLNTTNSSDKGYSFITFPYNKEGNFTVNITETLSDYSNGTCLNARDDCTVSYWLYDGTKTILVKDGDRISIPSNTDLKKIMVNMSCVAYSCPQSRDIAVRLNQIA